MSRQSDCYTRCENNNCSCDQKVCPPGPVGARGEAGLSAYEVAVQQGFKGTEEEWLASLVGPQGVQGAPGTPGQQGEPGTPGAGAIIPFASGLPVSLTTAANDKAGLPAFIGFGSAAQGTSQIQQTINLVGGIGVPANFAFSMPRGGTITSFAAYFSTTAAISGSPTNVYAAIYESTVPNNTFTLIADSETPLLPSIIAGASVGTIAKGIMNFNYTVAAGTRLMVVFFATNLVAGTISGYASAGIGIA